MKFSKLIPVFILLLSSDAFASAGGAGASAGSSVGSGTGTTNSSSGSAISPSGSSTTNQSIGSSSGTMNKTNQLNNSNPMNNNLNNSSTGSTSNTAGTANITDDNLTTNVQQRFQGDNLTGGTSGSNINIRSLNGTVYLSGSAKTQAEADRAASTAKSIEGVKNVDNSIVVEEAQ